MAPTKSSVGDRVRAWLDKLLAVGTSRALQPDYARDPYNIFVDDLSDRRALQVAASLAILFHLLLFLIVFPSLRDKIFIPTEQVVILKELAKPAAHMGGEQPQASPPKPPTMPKPKPIFVPIPDPTPHAPEPIRKKEIEDIPEIVAEIGPELNIGDVAAPPGPPGKGGGSGPLEGPGSGSGGDGIYEYGSGIINPELVVKTTPSYTDEAIKAKAQGIVVLQAVIRKDGRVDSFKVLRSLGYGLEEKAIQEIHNRWRFRPGTLNGKPVDVLATIEVQFNLR